MLKSSDDIYVVVFLGMMGTFVLCGAIILFYVRYQKKLFLQQQQMKDAEIGHQVQMLHSILQSQEDERRRIGRDLHDDVGGALANLRLAISKVAKAENLQDLKPLIINCQVLTDNVINNVRHISHNLSPSGLELFGFADILAELCDQTAKASGLAIILKNDTGLPSGLPGLNISIALYRVMQELIANTLKHAGAKAITIELYCQNDAIVIDYADDGCGIDPAKPSTKGIGRNNITSRLSMIQATFATGTKEQPGFNIHIEVPFTLNSVA